jgi:dolichyl-phosphate mannosyltransferase polypeptide 3
MLKYQKWLIFFIVFFFVWLGICKFSSEYIVNPRIQQIAFVLPMYLLVTFGAYSLAVIALNVMAVSDCVEAAKELDEEVKQAKEDLRKKGMNL